ncbi:hypothetical protein IG631_24076 [Alternaria alternata]|nr:hypothetical protein IG631_24076 [Alternaria alternata]
MTVPVLTASAPCLQNRPPDVRDGEGPTSASLDSGSVQASRLDEDEVGCTDHNGHDGYDSSLKRKRSKQDQFPCSYKSSRHQMSPLSLQPPGYITTISEQDSLRKRRSDDTYGSNSEAEPLDVQSQNSGNFALLLCAADSGGYSKGCTSVPNSLHVGDGNFTWPDLRAPTPNNSPYGSSSPSNLAVTPFQCTYPTSQIGTQKNADACRPQILSSSITPSIPGYVQRVGIPVSRE